MTSAFLLRDRQARPADDRAVRRDIRRVVVLNWKDASHPEAGGAEVYCEQVARELVADGLEVTLVCGRAPGLPARETRDGIEIRRMGSTYTVYLLALLWLLRHRRRIDGVIDSQNGFPFFSPLVVRRSTPVALLIHHVHQEQFGMYFGRVLAAVGRFLESTATRAVYGNGAVCAVSPSTRTEVRRRLRLRGPVYVVPNGAVPAGTAHTRARTPTIACVGRLTTHKRWDLLLAALPEVMREVPDLTVDVVGAGPDTARLRALAGELGITHAVTFHGYVPTEVRDALLGRAWFTVSTSVGEGWGLSVIEAAAVGVPAVAFDVPGLRDSVRDGVTGWLTSEDRLAATLVEAVTALADDDVAVTMAHDCVEWAGSFRWSSTADRLRAVLDQGALAGSSTDRRGPTRDAATLVTLSRSAARHLDRAGLRATDETNFCPACLDRLAEDPVVVLHGCDEVLALDVLARAGLPSAVFGSTARLCRPRDLVQWHGGALPHAHPDLDDSTVCPNGRRRPRAHAVVDLYPMAGERSA